ncbi:MAG: S9 family peptidase [Polyangiales bacterium]
MDIAPYGTWQSPLAPSVLARGHVRISCVVVAPDGSLVWSELRSAEQGRTTLIHSTPDGRQTELLPPPYSARTRVHEYGGRSFVVADTRLWFVNQSDQQLHVRNTDGTIAKLTAAADTRFAEPIHDAPRERLIAIAERHAADGKVDNFIASIELASGRVSTLVAGHDFYASPALSPDGASLAYLAWNHPHMPWDAAELHRASLAADGSVADHSHVAGSPTGSAQQPTWSPAGELYFALELDDTWALHRVRDGAPQQVAAVSGELGAPLWQLGTQLWAFVQPQVIVGVAFAQGVSRLVEIDVGTGQSRVLSDAFAYVGQVAASQPCDYVAISLGWTGSGSELLRYELTSGRVTPIKRTHEGLLSEADTSLPEAVAFTTSHGDVAHGFYYAPKNSRVSAPAGSLPPLIVVVHGGPTAGAAAVFSPTVQFFTTRGFAVLDVNYRGSSGYGRSYRERLRGQWGLLDVDDCVAGARYLADSRRVDPARLVIRGGSAGGYTVLQALANHPVFAAGSCHYGVSDLEVLSRDTHKFESHYDRFLVGPYPERRDLFVARSPIHYVERIDQPVIFFQGLDDKVVPANQTERMANTLRERGVTTEYHAYAGEQHGFRKAETIEHVLETELAFLRRVLAL